MKARPWQPISTAPKGVHVEIRMKRGAVYKDAHWASDLSGEEQPAFQGWFKPILGSDGRVLSYSEIPGTPVEWRPLKTAKPSGTPCITLWQPWASWVALGWKTIETREHRRFDVLACQRIGIHASKFWDKTAFDQARPYLTPEQLALDHPLYRRRGELLCTAWAENADPSWLTAADSKAALIDCDPDKVIRFGLRLRDIRLVEPPRKVRGGQGIFYLDV